MHSFNKGNTFSIRKQKARIVMTERIKKLLFFFVLRYFVEPLIFRDKMLQRQYIIRKRPPDLLRHFFHLSTSFTFSFHLRGSMIAPNLLFYCILT